MMNPGEYFALFYRAKIIEDSLCNSSANFTATAPERLHGGCLLYRFPHPAGTVLDKQKAPSAINE